MQTKLISLLATLMLGVAGCSGGSDGGGLRAWLDAGPGAALQEILGLVLIAFGLLSGLALWSYAPEDPAWVWEPVSNAAGVAGASIASSLVANVGGLVCVSGSARDRGFVLEASVPYATQ